MGEMADLAAGAAIRAGCWPGWQRAGPAPPPPAAWGARHDHGVIRPGTSADRWHPRGVSLNYVFTKPAKLMPLINI